MRSKNIDTLSNAGFNLVNGDDRFTVDVPYHDYYNPRGGSQLGRVGAQVFGDGFAGRPLRGMEKQFGKRVATEHGALWAAIGKQDNNNINGSFSQPQIRPTVSVSP